MKYIAIAILGVFTLSGCATQTAPLSKSALKTLHGREVTIVAQKHPDFRALTGGKIAAGALLLGPFVVLSTELTASAHGYKIINDNHVENPAKNVAINIAKKLPAKGLKVKNKTAPVEVHTGNLAKISEVADAQDLILHTSIIRWGTMYYLGKIDNYKLHVIMKLSLLDVKSAKPVVSYICKYETHYDDPDDAPTWSYLFKENEAAGFKKELRKAEDHCTQDFLENAFI